MRVACLVVAAERAPGSMERVLAVTRLGLALCVDLLRPSDDPIDAPPLVLDFHHLATRDLGEPGAGQGPARLLVHQQELCAYSSDMRFAAHAATGRDVALLQLRMTPRATVKLPGALSKGASVLVELVGSAVLRLVAHGEDYFMQLPNLLLEDPLSAAACQPSLTGTLEVRCAGTGMSASVAFQPGTAVRGAVSRLQGKGTVEVAAISGSWADTVEVTAPEWEARGVLYSGAEVRPSAARSVRLQRLEPMWMPHVWSAIRDALLSASAGTSPSKKTEALASKLLNLLEGGQQDSTSDLVKDGAVHLPPCIQAERDAGRRLRYELKYVVCKAGNQ